VLSANSRCKLSLSPKRSPRDKILSEGECTRIPVTSLAFFLKKTWKFFLLLFQKKQRTGKLCDERERVEFSTAV
jgi:hypothetical protein